MNGIGATSPRDVKDSLNVQVGLGRCRRTDVISLVGLHHMQSSAIDIGENGNGMNTHFTARTNHAHGDLATIRDEDLFEWD